MFFVWSAEAGDVQPGGRASSSSVRVSVPHSRSSCSSVVTKSSVVSNNRSYALISSCVRFFGGDGIAGLSQILCKHRNAVQIEQNLFKAEVAQAASRLVFKIAVDSGHVKGGGASPRSS